MAALPDATRASTVVCKPAAVRATQTTALGCPGAALGNPVPVISLFRTNFAYKRPHGTDHYRTSLVAQLAQAFLESIRNRDWPALPQWRDAAKSAKSFAGFLSLPRARKQSDHRRGWSNLAPSVRRRIGRRTG